MGGSYPPISLKADAPTSAKCRLVILQRSILPVCIFLLVLLTFFLLVPDSYCSFMFQELSSAS